MTLSVQFITLLSMIGMGIILGMSVDTYQLLLRMHFSSKWKKAVNDILFWVLYSMLFFGVLYKVNEGTIRFYVFLAVLCGYAMYRSLLESIYVFILMKVVRFIQRTLDISVKIFKKLILNPIRWIIMFVYSCVQFILRLVYRVIRKVLRWIYLVIYTLLKGVLKILWVLTPKRVKCLLIKGYNKVSKFGYRCIAWKGKVILVYRKCKSALHIKKR